MSIKIRKLMADMCWLLFTIVFSCISNNGAGMNISLGESCLNVSGVRADNFRYVFKGTEIISGAELMIEKKGKRILMDNPAYTRRNMWGGTETVWHQSSEDGEVRRKILLGPRQINVQWEIDAKETPDVISLSLYVPEISLGQVPFSIKYHDGRVEEGTLWVEPRGVTRGMQEIVFYKTGQEIIFSFPERGWCFEDQRWGDKKERPFAFTFSPGRLTAKQNIGFSLKFGKKNIEFFSVNLRKASNMGFKDEAEGDKAGGWTDQGANDMRNFPTGIQHFMGIPFDIIIPGENNGKAVVVLKDAVYRPYFLEKVEVPVEKKAAALYFLHAAAWSPPGKSAAAYHINYQDGTSEVIHIRVGHELVDWWDIRKTDVSYVGWSGANSLSSSVGLSLFPWENPCPEKVIKSVSFESTGKAVAMIVSVTGSSEIVKPSAGYYRGTSYPPIKMAKYGDFNIEQSFIDTGFVDESEFAVRTGKEIKDLRETDIVSVSTNVEPEQAQKIVDFVNNGGGLFFIGYPTDSLKSILPVEEKGNLIEVAPRGEKWSKEPVFLVPTDAMHPVFSGIPDGTFTPVGGYLEVEELPDAAVLARWNKNGPPALLYRKVGKGRVLYLAAPPDQKYLRTFFQFSPYWDQFIVKMVYFLAGEEQSAKNIGGYVQAREKRNSLLSSFNEMRVNLENLKAVAGYVSSKNFITTVDELEKQWKYIQNKIGEADGKMLQFNGADALPIYAIAEKYLEELTERMSGFIVDGKLNNVIINNLKEIKAIQIEQGEPPLIGATHLMYYRHLYPYFVGKGPTRQWFYEKDFSILKEKLNWNLHDIFIGYDFVKATADWHNPGKDDFDFTTISKIIGAARKNNVRLILIPSEPYASENASDYFTRGTVPYTDESNSRRAFFLKQLAEYFDKDEVIYGFEPRNEGCMGTPSWSSDVSDDPRNGKFHGMLGYDKLLIEKFQERLEKKYVTINNLNRLLETDYKKFSDVYPPKRREIEGESDSSPARMLWGEWIYYRFDIFEDWYKANYLAIKSVSRKPVIDRTAALSMKNCAYHAVRVDRLAKWHDVLGNHVQGQYLLDYQKGLSGGKKLSQSEYYYHMLGSSSGLKYKYRGGFMQPDWQAETENFAAIGRNFWKTVSRGNYLWTIYVGNPQWTYRYKTYDTGYMGPCSIIWTDLSIKNQIYALKFYPGEYQRIRREIDNSEHLAQIAILEPLGSIVQNPGSLINFDILDVEHEVQVFYKYLQKKHYQAEIIPETEDFERYKVVIVPYGIYLSEEVQKKLLSYIEKGGLVVSTGPAGYYNELGQYSAFLLDSVAPEVKIQHNPSAVRTNIAGEDLTINAFWNFIEKEGKPAILDKKYGKGQMIVTTFPYLRNDAPVESILESCLKKYIREFIDIDNESIQIYIARNQKGKKNIFLINEDHVNAQKANIIFRKNLKISDLRAGVALLKPRNSMAIELKPGECRILQVD